MFDFIGHHKRLVQGVLALITLPFAFFGVDYYFRQGDATPNVATVAGEKITQAQFNESIAEQQDRMRQQLGRNFDAAMFDNPEVRYQVLERLIAQRLMQDKARRETFRVTDSQLQQVIAQQPAFQYDGQFSTERYKQVLASQNMTPLMFEDRVRRELILAPLQEPISLGNIVASSSGERYIGLVEQQREVAAAAIDPEPFMKEVRIDDAAVKVFYDANAKTLQTPELAKFEYVLLSQDALTAQVTLDPAEVKAQYEKNLNLYGQPEERDASHILIASKADATESDKAAARKKADDLAAQAKANPAKFAELAKQYSQDPGSAPQGGDLGMFSRGNMVKPFDDAVFAMKVDEIIGPVQTDFGYHIIKLNAINPAKVRSFDEVKTQIETDLKRQKAAQKFASAADQFQNLVYEQADSLQGAAKTLGLTVQTSPLVTRAQAQALAQGSAKFVQALFSPESVQSKRNVEATEVGPNALMSGRIIEYKPAALRPFEDAKEEIRMQLTRKSAGELAQKEGLEKLALLTQGKSEKEAGVTFAPPVVLNRTQVQAGFSSEALTQIFQIDPARLPQYTGTANDRGGFSVYKIVKMIAPEMTDPTKLSAASTRLGDQLSQELFAAYVATLKAKADVKINQANLEKK